MFNPGVSAFPDWVELGMAPGNNATTPAWQHSPSLEAYLDTRPQHLELLAEGGRGFRALSSAALWLICHDQITPSFPNDRPRWLSHPPCGRGQDGEQPAQVN